ncbi:MAG TPA: hypothetical protein VJV04_15100 [Nitrospiraceae bacterium]|nr:hypothetical protein [Nitrospiraceae bacterium]
MAFHLRFTTVQFPPRINAGLVGCMCLAVISAFIFSEALAGTPTRPFWTEQAMFQFGEDRFFVGQSSCAKTAEEGRQQAFRHGMQEILNYAQARDMSGLYVDTQMVFEEAASPGCPRNTVTVWRLLRMDARRLAKLAASSRHPKTIEGDQSSTILPILPPSIGMSRDEVFDRLGLPASTTLHHGNEFTWEYRRYGLAVEFDRHMFVKRWTTLGPAAHESSTPRRAQPMVVPNEAPIVDLTSRLRNLEQSGQEGGLTVSTVYNQVVFSRRPMPAHTERSLSTTEAAAPTFNISSRHDAISDKVSGLWTCRAEDGSPGRGAFISTKRGIIISPACTNPWNR